MYTAVTLFITLYNTPKGANLNLKYHTPGELKSHKMVTQPFQFITN